MDEENNRNTFMVTTAVAVLMISFMLPVSASASEKLPTSAISAQQTFTVVGVLFFIVGLIVFLSWFVKRINHGAYFNKTDMKILSTLPLGTRERIVLVDIGKHQILVGVCQSNISLIQYFPEPIIKSECAPKAENFAKRLHEILHRAN